MSVMTVTLPLEDSSQCLVTKLIRQCINPCHLTSTMQIRCLVPDIAKIMRAKDTNWELAANLICRVSFSSELQI